MSRYREVHLDGNNATIIARGDSPAFIGRPEGTTVKAVGAVKGGKMYYQENAIGGRIENIIFDGNQRAWDAARGIWIAGGKRTTISNCTVQNVSHSGLTVLGRHVGLVVRDCTFKDISWPEMVICSAQGVQAEFKVSCSTGEVEEGWLKRPTNALMERWLADEWTARDVKEYGMRGYDKQLYPMDVGYLHGIYLTGRQRDCLIENCSFENINWGFGINITGDSYNVKVNNCRFVNMGKGCTYIGNADKVEVSEFEAVKCATLVHLYRHGGEGEITFRNGRASEISHYAFYVLDYNGNVNLNILNNKINGCGRAFLGSTGGSNFIISGNQIENLQSEMVWEHMRNNRDNSQAAISNVAFFNNTVSFKKAGVSVFGPRSPVVNGSLKGLGPGVEIRDNTFENIASDRWNYSRLAGFRPVSKNNNAKASACGE